MLRIRAGDYRFTLKLALAGALLTSVSAFAADLGPGHSVTIAPVAQPFTWTGVYFGALVGYSWGDDPAAYLNPVFDGLAGSLTTKPQGAYGGGEIGYNYQFGNAVLGIEADLEFGNIRAKIPDILGDLHDPPGPYSITGSSDYSGSLRARLGYAFDRFLPFITGGYAWAHSKVSSDDGPVSDSATLGGWVFGGGLEYAFDQHWSAKAEYLHADFGSHTWFADQVYASRSTSRTDSIRFGVNYRF